MSAMVTQSLTLAAEGGADGRASPAATAPGSAGEGAQQLHPAVMHPAVMLEAFVHSIERLEQILERETILLQRHEPTALRDFNHRKSHGLLEFSRSVTALRAMDPAAVDLAAQAPLVRLRSKLSENLAILKLHLDAVSEIAAIVARAMQEHESDGTYTPRLPGEGGRR